MKKWYAGVGVLAVALGISLGTCCLTEAHLDEFRGDYYDVSEELEANESEFSDIRRELDDVKSELMQLKATKEISFGNGLKVFDIEKASYEVCGKVQNVSSEPMQKVVVVVAFYNKDGQLDEDWGSVETCSLRDLFPGEVIEWEANFSSWTDQDVGLFDVYAIGNKR